MIDHFNEDEVNLFKRVIKTVCARIYSQHKNKCKTEQFIKEENDSKKSS